MSGEQWQKGYSKYNPGEGVLSEEPRPWNFLDIAKDYIPSGAHVLDVGCGNGKKLQELLTTYCLKVSFTGFDKNEDSLQVGKHRFETSGLPVPLLRANLEKSFPFPDETFDVVTFMLATHNADQAYRVLKPGGLVLMERVGEEDKRDIKLMFGNDESGKPRGYNLSKPGVITLTQYAQDFRNAGFQVISQREGKWQSFHSVEGLEALLKNTPFVDKYDTEKDRVPFDAVVRKFTTPQGIGITQHRVLIIAQR